MNSSESRLWSRTVQDLRHGLRQIDLVRVSLLERHGVKFRSIRRFTAARSRTADLIHINVPR